jgi:hypothetical protein
MTIPRHLQNCLTLIFDKSFDNYKSEEIQTEIEHKCVSGINCPPFATICSSIIYKIQSYELQQPKYHFKVYNVYSTDESSTMPFDKHTCALFPSVFLLIYSYQNGIVLDSSVE